MSVCGSSSYSPYLVNESRREAVAFLAMPFFLWLLVSSIGAQEAPLSAEQVVNRAEAKFKERVANEEAVLSVKLIDERGRVNVRTVRYLTAYGRDGAGNKLLVRFTEPADIRGAGILNLENPGGEDTQYLYLKSVGKARRIAAANRRDRFIGTDYSIGDTRSENMRLWTYQHLEEETLTFPPEYGGATVPTYRLEAVSQEGADTDYTRRVLWYHRDIGILVKEEMYDRDGLAKTRTRWGFAPFAVEGEHAVLRAQFEEMRDNRNRSRTVLETTERHFNQNLPDSTFTTRELERGR